jgi:hypothetical protein
MRYLYVRCFSKPGMLSRFRFEIDAVGSNYWISTKKGNTMEQGANAAGGESLARAQKVTPLEFENPRWQDPEDENLDVRICPSFHPSQPAHTTKCFQLFSNGPR